MKFRLGASEQAVVNEVSARQPVGVKELFDHFRTSRGWSRSSVQKMLDRLLAKGLVEREAIDGVFQYRAALSQMDLEAGVIDRFVQGHLGGAVTPLVAYLHDRGELTPEDALRLRKLLDELEGRP